MDEDNTHLLLATNWDVQGGAGGAPGRHGQPGQGGKGGKGGAGHKWQVSSNVHCQRLLLIYCLGCRSELVGYRYDCTSRCIGQTDTSKSTSLVRAGSRVGSGA